MEQLPQQLINGIWQGAVLALFALGYTLVFGGLSGGFVPRERGGNGNR